MKLHKFQKQRELNHQYITSNDMYEVSLVTYSYRLKTLYLLYMPT